MADFASLVADVYTLTNRPDLVAETALAVKAATLKMHKSDFYFKDLFESGVQFDQIDYLQTLKYRLLFPKYRALKYIRKFDASVAPGLPGKFYEIISPEEVLDSYKIQRNDVAYVAGSVIQVRSSTKDQYCLMGVYLHPTVESPATFSSWIADEQPYAIIFEAASQIYGLLENNNAQQKYTAEAADQITELKAGNIIAVGS
jgi:hypothetical protein